MSMAEEIVPQELAAYLYSYDRLFEVPESIVRDEVSLRGLKYDEASYIVNRAVFDHRVWGDSEISTVGAIVLDNS